MQYDDVMLSGQWTPEMAESSYSDECVLSYLMKVEALIVSPTFAHASFTLALITLRLLLL